MKYEDKLLDHDYDGIQELDNQLPPWWLNLFYITIIWAIGYFLYYHVLEIGDLSADEYRREMGLAVAEKSSSGFLDPYVAPYSKTPAGGTYQQPTGGSEAGSPLVTENENKAEQMFDVNYELVTETGRLNNGANVYKMNCLACHGANGEGTIGPNFTDTFEYPSFLSLSLALSANFFIISIV